MNWIITVAAFLVFAADTLPVPVRFGALCVGIIGFVLVLYRTVQNND